MNIKRSVEKIPGGMMIVPLFLGACLNTFAPNTGKFFGSFTNGMITGTLPILSVWFFCMGASISLKAAPIVLRKSGVLVSVKVLTAAVVAMLAVALHSDRAASTAASSPGFRCSPSWRR